MNCVRILALQKKMSREILSMVTCQHRDVGSGEAGNKSITDLYEKLPNEAIILNTIGAALVGLAIVMPCILKCDAFKKGLEPEAGEDSDIE